jgi:hypothetical protein
MANGFRKQAGAVETKSRENLLLSRLSKPKKLIQ